MAVYRLAIELNRLGHKVSVVTLNTRHVKNFETVQRVQVYRAYPVEFTRSLGVQGAISPEALTLMRRVCVRERIDVIHANSLLFFTTIMACAHKVITRTPLLTTVHGGSMSEFEGIARLFTTLYEKTISRWILRESDHITIVSRALMEYLQGLGTPTRKITVVPNAVDIQEFKPRHEGRVKDGSTTVAYVGRLLWNKGPQYLIEAAPRITHESPRVKFLIVGEGPMLGQLQRKVNQLGLNKQFQFLGFVPSVAQFLRGCDILVRPSLNEGMPLTVLEAMACGIPTVASNIAGTPQILSHGETGFLIEPKDTKQLAFYVTKLAKDQKLRHSMGRRARAFTEKTPGWSSVASQMSRLYDSVLENSRHSRTRLSGRSADRTSGR